MSKSSFLQKLTIAGIAGIVSVVGIQTSASAGTFLAPFSGGSGFGQVDPDIPESCPLCDSVTNFTVFQNTDGDWRDEVGAAATWLTGPSDGTERYVYMYQFENTDQISPDNVIDTFSVAKTGVGLDPFAPEPSAVTPYRSAGYFADTGFSGFDNTAADDRRPNGFNDGRRPGNEPYTTAPLTTVTGTIDPNNVNLNGLITNNSLANYSGQATRGAIFSFPPQTVSTNGRSSVMFLASNEPPNWVWAETESIGGEGAAGDVPGVNNVVPEPMTILGSFAALGFGSILKRQKKQKISN